MSRIRLAVLAASLSVISLASADVIVFNSATGDLGPTHNYTLDGVIIVAAGFNPGGDSSLYGKNNGGDEKGLGLVADPSHDHEIWYRSSVLSVQDFIQLDVLNLLKNGFTNIQFKMGSTTHGEQWSVSACGTSGALCSNGDTVSGTGEKGFKAPTNLSLTDHYLDFYSSKSVPGSGNNVLLTGLSATDPVPEPGYGFLLVGGLLAAVALGYRRSARRA